MDFQSAEHIERALFHLGELLDAEAAQPIALLACGAASLIVQGLVPRTTNDIDLLAYFGHDPPDQRDIERHTELPPTVSRLVARVAADMDLDETWLNLGPSSLVQLGLPDGLLARALPKRYGRALTVFYVDRLDQVHLKLYACLSGEERHVADLKALRPTDAEMLQARRWIETAMADGVLRSALEALMRDLGYGHVI